jgi:hypothetical protein
MLSRFLTAKSKTKMRKAMREKGASARHETVGMPYFRLPEARLLNIKIMNSGWRSWTRIKGAA